MIVGLPLRRTHHPFLRKNIANSSMVFTLILLWHGPAGRGELQATPAVAKATQQGWGRLRPGEACGERNPREWLNVATEAKREGTDVHAAIVFGFSVEKSSALPTGDPR